MDIPRHLDELYEKAVKEGMIPWNDAKTGYFTMRIRVGNAAMSTPEDVARALETVASRLKDGYTEGVIHDANGNLTGDWDFDDGTTRPG
jgi:hypothetical protein